MAIYKNSILYTRATNVAKEINMILCEKIYTLMPGFYIVMWDLYTRL